MTQRHAVLGRALALAILCQLALSAPASAASRPATKATAKKVAPQPAKAAPSPKKTTPSPKKATPSSTKAALSPKKATPSPTKVAAKTPWSPTKVAPRPATVALPATVAPRPAAPVTTPAGPQTWAYYQSVRIDGVPHVKQKPDFCAEACAEMYLRKLGRPITQDDVFDQAGVDPLQARGCYTADLVTALKKIGFNCGAVWFNLSAANPGPELEQQWRALHADLLRGVPSIVCSRYDTQPNTTEHFRLVLGYDARTDEVIYHEPAEAAGAYRRMSRTTFKQLWALPMNASFVTVVRVRLEPVAVSSSAVAAPAGLRPSDYAQHMMQLKKQIPAGAGFSVTLQPPFLVVGNSSPAVVKALGHDIVGWAVARLKREYFPRDPARVLDIWLFKDQASYTRYARQVFNDEPTTPYGYYLPARGALLMNIGTGTGTLVHELVHPFVRANFPTCPAWFNEGLGSLYEQCSERGGRIVGLPNWRLRYLQTAISQGTVESFARLTAGGDAQFYNDPQGVHYAQARYLCYYLQERGLLARYFREFAANAAVDPTGYRTLSRVLGESDMAAFQQRWQAWVMGLRYQ